MSKNSFEDSDEPRRPNGLRLKYPKWHGSGCSRRKVHELLRKEGWAGRGRKPGGGSRSQSREADDTTLWPLNRERPDNDRGGKLSRLFFIARLTR